MMTKSTKGTMIRKLLTAALLATTIVGSAAPALALDQGHAQLLNAVHARGIKLYNDADVCRENENIDGFYHGASGSLVLCSEGTWENLSENDLDTIRHETVHFIQDCADGNIDGSLGLVLKPGAAVRFLQQAGLDPRAIVHTYTENGKAEHVPQELEAFGVAGAMGPEAITTALNAICPLR